MFKEMICSMYIYKYKTKSVFDDILLNSDREYLTGLWFKNSKDEKKHILKCKKANLPIFRETIKWLDMYFSGIMPDFTPKYKIEKLTEFRKNVIDIMLKIPYGKMITYGDIAKKIAKKYGIEKMSSRAVGGAVGFNPICIIIPCHRVIGVNNKITGYGGGINNKIELLKLEGADITKFR